MVSYVEGRILSVFENRVLMRTFELKRGELLHNEELHNLCSSSNIIRHIKAMRMRWAGHIASMREEGKRRESWWETWKEGDHSEDRSEDGRMG
jgi:hypothetical protein